MIGGLSKINRYLLAGAGVIGHFGCRRQLSVASAATSGRAARAAIVRPAEAGRKRPKRLRLRLKPPRQTAGGSDLDLKVKWKGAPELSSSDGKFKFKVRGRVDDRLQRHRPGRTYHRRRATSARSNCAGHAWASKASCSTIGNTSSRSISPLTRSRSRTPTSAYAGLDQVDRHV